MNDYAFLSFEEGINFMKRKCTEVKNGNQRSLDVFPNLKVIYPGRKANGDYLFTVSGKALKHSATCVIIASYVLNGTLNYSSA